MSNTWSESEIPFLMDNVDCGSGSTIFLSCSRTNHTDDGFDDSDNYDNENCYHDENVLLTCFESGEFKFYSFIVSQ